MTDSWQTHVPKLAPFIVGGWIEQRGRANARERRHANVVANYLFNVTK